MKKIKEIETLVTAVENNEMGIGECSEKINFYFFHAYNIATRESHNPMIDFNEVIWEKDIPGIVANCKEYGITEFTISSTFSSLITTLAEFEKLGCTMAGLVKVNSRYKSWDGEEHDVIPAILMKVK